MNLPWLKPFLRFGLFFFFPPMLFCQGQSVNDLFDQGVHKLESGRVLEAIEDFNLVIKKYPDYYEAYNERGKAWQALRKTNQALADFAKAASLNPKWVEPWLNRARLHMEIGKKDPALTDLTRAIEVKSTQTDAYEMRAGIFEEQRKFEPALKDYSKAIELKTRNQLMYTGKARLLNQLNRHDEALSLMNSFLKEYPRSGNGFFQRGVARFYLKAVREAAGDFEHASQLGLALADLTRFRARVFFDLQQYVEAISECNVLISKYRQTDNEVRFIRGKSFLESQQPAEAIKDFTHVINNDRSHFEAYYLRGDAYNQLNKETYATADFGHALKLRPECHEAYYRRGLNHFLKKRYELALSDMNQAVKFGKLPPYYYYRGAVYLEMDMRKEACADLKKASSLGYAEADKDWNRLCQDK
jgi:tetratricopeptide (TPR) repeat protein